MKSDPRTVPDTIRMAIDIFLYKNDVLRHELTLQISDNDLSALMGYGHRHIGHDKTFYGVKIDYTPPILKRGWCIKSRCPNSEWVVPIDHIGSTINLPQRCKRCNGTQIIIAAHSEDYL